MTPALVLTLRDGIRITEHHNGGVTVAGHWGMTAVSRLSPGMRAALRMLSAEGGTEDELSQLIIEIDGIPALASFYYRLHRWSDRGWLCYSLFSSGGAVVSVIPMSAHFRPSCVPAPWNSRFRLSRFAFCRRHGDTFVLESPVSPARTILSGPASAALIGSLAQPRSPEELATQLDEWSAETIQAFVGILSSANLIAEVDDNGLLSEDTDPSLMLWEFHDLLFHSRSRPGAHDHAVGAHERLLGEIAPLPAVKTTMSNGPICLYRPDLDRLAREGPSLASVLEERVSRREYDSRPITLDQLGEFLYRVARVRSLTDPNPNIGLHYEVSSRPYPSGGAVYDLELYVTVDACDHLLSGSYHYDPLHHQLHALAERNIHVATLLLDAKLAAGLAVEPQILITLACRFGRISWKYSGLAYALSLKNVGVLLQSMYLVATAMDLAPCALGSGNSDLFARATGTNRLEEPAVGEFILGSRRRDA